MTQKAQDQRTERRLAGDRRVPHRGDDQADRHGQQDTIYRTGPGSRPGV